MIAATRKKILPYPLLSGVLLAMWLLLSNSLTLAQGLLGALFAGLLPLLLGEFLAPLPSIKKPLLLLRFLLRVLGDIAVANVQVAVLVIKPNRLLRPAFIELPLAMHDEFVIAVLMSVITLTPGTLAVGLSDDGKHLTIHALHTEDPALLIVQLKQRYEQPLLEIFAC
ncbi:MAG TPA: Na+/H+ antiporter subunit E [Spongiibacteraceae bacterium]|nr:Na+/H+ antiporter subunit E [Spongiibacteraceae bacterium]